MLVLEMLRPGSAFSRPEVLEWWGFHEMSYEGGSGNLTPFKVSGRGTLNDYSSIPFKRFKKGLCKSFTSPLR